jgi:hypothetical protein
MVKPTLRRTVRYRDKGADVEAHGGALHRYLHTGDLKAFRESRLRVRQTFGIAKRSLTKKAAAKAGLPAYGVIGPALYDAMWQAEAYDETCRNLLAEYAASLDKLDPRQRVIDAARFYLANAKHISYLDSRPIITLSRDIRPPDIPPSLDCSGLGISCYFAAGVEDVLGQENAHGYGNTWSLAEHGRPISVVQLRPADLIFYGNCSHVAIYEGNGKIITNGHYPMSRERVSYRSDYWGARSYLP